MSPHCFRSLSISFAALAIITSPGSAFTIGSSITTVSSEQTAQGSTQLEVTNDFARANDSEVTVSAITQKNNITKPLSTENVTLHKVYSTNTTEEPSQSLEVIAALSTTLDDLNMRVIYNLQSMEEIQNVTPRDKTHTDIINEINALQETTIDTAIAIETGTDINNLDNMFYATTQLENKNSSVLYVTPDGSNNSTIIIGENINNDTETNTGDSDSAGTILHAVNLTEVVVKELPSTTPPWNKYSEIARERTSPAGELTTESTQTEVIKKVTSINNTKVSLDDAFSITSEIPSLENLKNEFLLFTKKQSTEIEPTTTLNKLLEYNISKETVKDNSIITTTDMINSETTAKKDELRLLNHGMIDGYSVVPVHTTSVPSAVVTITQNELNTYENIFEQDSNAADTKTTSEVESRRHLMEDVIKEELLEEEILNNNKENADKRPVVSTPGSTAGDKMIITPMIQEKSRNISVYTVSSNYKPMKKIDVQPPKQFVRNPDDNSWRNESLNSLGITFKAHNSSKTFTQVLRNKTEVELKNIIELEKENRSKENKMELRKRLEEIAEKRKSKKKKFNGTSTDYNDYEELNASNESTEATKPEAPSDTINATEKTLSTSSSTTAAPPLITTTSPPTTAASVKLEKSNKLNTYDNSGYLTHGDYFTTLGPKKIILSEYYDDNEQSDVDYLAGIDLKKFTFPMHTTNTPSLPVSITQTIGHYPLDRKATIQYFPPTSRTTQKVNVNDYDLDFQRKVYAFTTKMFPPSSAISVAYTTKLPDTSKDKIVLASKIANYAYNPEELNRELYFSGPRDSRPHVGFTVSNQGNMLDEKSYSNYFEQAEKLQIDEKSPEYIQTYTLPPLRGVTINELAKTEEKIKDHDYDYETNFRKDILNRFVDNFNENSDRYKVDFPIVYNNSVVHQKAKEDGKVVASSSAFMRRLFSPHYYSERCPPPVGCSERDNVTVELAPAYELHYYVPDQEEKEELDPRSNNYSLH